jgi:drug/metabolite transporter (DMT)-like permease
MTTPLRPTTPPIATSAAARPWWREPFVWMIIAGPAAVVVAGIATTILAYRGSDRLLADDYYQRGLALSRTMQPAVAVRNGAVLRPAGAAPAPRPTSGNR